MTSLISGLWSAVETLTVKLLQRIGKFFGLNFSNETIQVLLQFIKFGIVGISNSVVNYAVYVGSLLLFRQFSLLANADYLCAQVVAFVLSVLWSFYWNQKYVFQQDKGKHTFAWFPSLVKTFVSYSFTGLILSEALLLLWINVLKLSEFIAPILNILICMPLNFILNKVWAFKNKTISLK